MVEGFENYLNNPLAYHLDKDIKQQGKEYKIYSPQTCIFVSIEENINQKNYDYSINKNKYFGLYKLPNSTYQVKVHGIYVGTFCNEIAAANAYNYFAIKYNLPVMLNDVLYMPVEEWSKYHIKFKEMCKII
jgi:hypothetical protein